MKRSPMPPRRTGLRSDPEKSRAWRQKGATNWNNRRRRTPGQSRRYQQMRVERAAMADNRCEATGWHAHGCSGFGEHAHHVLPRQFGGRDEISNLRWVSDKCHAYLHSNPVESELRGVLDRGSGLFGLWQHLPKAFFDKVDIQSVVECWEWTAHRNAAGYGRFRHDAETQLAHRLSIGLLIRDDGFACHKCDNRGCVNPLHLYRGDINTNTADMIERRGPVAFYGSDHARSVDEDTVFAVRWLALHGLGSPAIASQLGKSDKGWVSRVRNGKRWPHGPWPRLDRPDDIERAAALGLLDRRAVIEKMTAKNRKGTTHAD